MKLSFLLHRTSTYEGSCNTPGYNNSCWPLGGALLARKFSLQARCLVIAGVQFTQGDADTTDFRQEIMMNLNIFLQMYRFRDPVAAFGIEVFSLILIFFGPGHLKAQIPGFKRPSWH